MQVARVAPDWPVPSLLHRRRVVRDRITYVGLDVHKDAIVAAVAEGGRRGEVRGLWPHRQHTGGFGSAGSQAWPGGVELRFCYEAGPCGYGIQRQLSARRARLRCRGTVSDPEAAGRADQDGSTGRIQPREAAPGGRTDSGVGSRSRPRGRKVISGGAVCRVAASAGRGIAEGGWRASREGHAPHRRAARSETPPR